MKICVLHNISPDADLGLNFDLASRKTVPASHPLVKVFEFTADELYVTESRPPAELVADGMFYAFNVGDDPEFSVPGSSVWKIALSYRARRLRSLSVGDVLVLAGEDSAWEYLACGPAGWDGVQPGELRIVDGQEAELLIRQRYEIGDGEQLSATVPWEEQ